MKETLNDFIARRKREIEAEAEPLRQQLASLQKELHDIEVAQEAIGQSSSNFKPIYQAQEPRAPRGVIKRAVLKILAEKPRGLDALAILAELNDRLGTKYQRTSLSPQLSRLKVDGLVRLDGSIWIATNAGSEMAYWPADLPDEDEEPNTDAAPVTDLAKNESFFTEHTSDSEAEKESDVRRISFRRRI